MENTPIAIYVRNGMDMRNFTVSQELEQRQVDGSLPAWILLQSDAVTSGSKHFATANGHQLAALVLASHVIQHGSVVDEGIQLPGGTESKGFHSDSEQICVFRGLEHSYPVLRLLRASSTPFWLYLTMWECISG